MGCYVRALLVDEETGEIISNIPNAKNFVVLEEGDKVIRANSLKTANKYKMDEHSMMEYRLDGFVKINADMAQWLGVLLGDKENAFMFRILPYVGYGCRLVYRNGKRIDVDEMVNITNVSRSTVYRCLKVLKENNVIKKNKQGEFVVNPKYFCKGNRVPLDVLELFNR